MKKIFLSAFIFFSIIIFNNCEQPFGEEEFPYELKLVIRGIIEPDQLIDNIYIGRTLPVAVPFNESFANLTDAVGAVVSDGVFYPLRYTANGIYTTDSLIARIGSSYHLLVQWQDKSISAETKIPISGSILSYGKNSFQEDGKTVTFMEGTISPRENESYTATWVIVNVNGTISSESQRFEQVVRSDNSQPLKVKTIAVPPSLVNAQGLGIRLYIYDSSFYDYFLSQGSGQVTDAIFGQSGTNVKWNIKGDGIGMFIGRMDIVRVL